MKFIPSACVCPLALHYLIKQLISKDVICLIMEYINEISKQERLERRRLYGWRSLMKSIRSAGAIIQSKTHPRSRFSFRWFITDSKKRKKIADIFNNSKKHWSDYQKDEDGELCVTTSDNNYLLIKRWKLS
jgi:hypothetical protein